MREEAAGRDERWPLHSRFASWNSWVGRSRCLDAAGDKERKM